MRAHAVRVRAPDAPDRDCVYPSTHPTRSFLRPLLWLSAPGSARCDRNQGAVLRPHWKGRSGSRRTLGPNAGDVRLAYVATARKPEARAGAGARQASSHGKEPSNPGTPAPTVFRGCRGACSPQRACWGAAVALRARAGLDSRGTCWGPEAASRLQKITEPCGQRTTLIGTNGSSVAFQKQEIATLDKFYLYHTPEILRSRGSKLPAPNERFHFPEIWEIFLFENSIFRGPGLSAPAIAGARVAYADETRSIRQNRVQGGF